MLALTENAVQAVRGIVSSSDQAPEIQLSVAALPSEDDEVVEEQGARVFLDPEAASLLADKVLDASVEQNQVAFTLAEQIER